ncbi:hypothetical protein ABKN59_008023 [Abortiporus biennis]
MHFQRIFMRAASTSSSSFPFPSHVRPTPYQIFHLPVGASQREIKARYYDLVRLHHPDSPHCRHLSPSLRHKHFQSITAAYEILKNPHRSTDDDLIRSEIARRRRAQDRRTQEAYMRREQAEMFGGGGMYPPNWNSPPTEEDIWKDRVIIAVGIFSLSIGVFMPLLWPLNNIDKVHLAASANLAQARREAREFGHERRQEIRKRVQEHREGLEGATETSSNDSN